MIVFEAQMYCLEDKRVGMLWFVQFRVTSSPEVNFRFCKDSHRLTAVQLKN